MEGVSVRVGARHASPVLVRVQNKQIADLENKKARTVLCGLCRLYRA